jgi:hypothetical protein
MTSSNKALSTAVLPLPLSWPFKKKRQDTDVYLAAYDFEGLVCWERAAAASGDRGIEACGGGGWVFCCFALWSEEVETVTGGLDVEIPNAGVNA